MTDTLQTDLALPKRLLVHRQPWKLVVSYDGTDFHGWQVQPQLRTVQGTLSSAIHSLTSERILPQGSGRTDAGVHASGQVASFELAAPVPPERLIRALNRILPPDLRVLSAEHAPEEFHARSQVLNKTYEYRIFPRRPLGSVTELPCPPTLARYVWDCRWPINLEPMQEAAQYVVGEHDFSSFVAHDPDRSARLQKAQSRIPSQYPDQDPEEDPEEDEDSPTNVRTIFSSDWNLSDGLLLYRVTGSGFLHHMVRNLVGTFVEVGCNRISPEAIHQILGARDRTVAGPTAPPQGLFLREVVYK